MASTHARTFLKTTPTNKTSQKAPIKKRTTARAKIAAKTRPVRPTPQEAGAAHFAPAVAQSEAAGDEDSAFSNFANSKRDKRVVKHSAFISKIEKANKKPLKRRRTGKGNLQTKLEGLVDALPDIEAAQNEDDDDDDDDDDWEGMPDIDVDEGPPVQTSGTGLEQEMLTGLANMVNVRKSIKKTGAQQQDAKMQMKTLKSGRGAAKRKEKLKGSEMERFAKNLAQMNQANVAVDAPAQPTIGGEAAAPAATANRWAALRGFIGQTMQQSSNFAKPA